MRIGDVKPAPVQAVRQGQRPSRAAEPPEPPAASDAVSLSRLSEMMRMVAASDARVARLREAFASGAYEPPAAELARKIVASHAN